MITVKLYKTSFGKPITVLSGIDSEIYDLRLIKRALKKITGSPKSKIMDSKYIVLSGSYVNKVNEFVAQIGF